MARNPGLNNNTEYGAGDFPLPARPPAGLAAQSTSRPSSMIRSQQTEEAYPDLSSLKRELEGAQMERARQTSTGIARSLRGTRQTWEENRRSSREIRRRVISACSGRSTCKNRAAEVGNEKAPEKTTRACKTERKKDTSERASRHSIET